MNTRSFFFALLILMIGCGAAVSLGQADPDVSLDSVREVWADILRDTDEFGLHTTRVPAAKEIALGDQIAAQMPAESADADFEKDQKYIAAVGAELTHLVNRTAIPYHFHLIRSTQINAFAIPGGHVYVYTGLLDFLQSEAELAAILGHEISHVDLRHCIERYQYELALRKMGLGDASMIVTFAHNVAAIGYTQYQELEADASGERIAIEAGYDPDAAAAVFERMKTKFGEPSRTQAATPAGEAGQVVGEALGAYFRTHPPSEDRARQLKAMAARNRQKLAGGLVYVGKTNYSHRVARTAMDLPQEKRVY